MNQNAACLDRSIGWLSIKPALGLFKFKRMTSKDVQASIILMKLRILRSDSRIEYAQSLCISVEDLIAYERLAAPVPDDILDKALSSCDITRAMCENGQLDVLLQSKSFSPADILEHSKFRTGELIELCHTFSLINSGKRRGQVLRTLRSMTLDKVKKKAVCVGAINKRATS